jgi:hypothetical protein
MAIQDFEGPVAFHGRDFVSLQRSQQSSCFLLQGFEIRIAG